MKTASGHEISIAWNMEQRDVVIEVDPDPDPRKWNWINLTPAEARQIGEYLLIMAKTCEEHVHQIPASSTLKLKKNNAPLPRPSETKFFLRHGQYERELPT